MDGAEARSLALQVGRCTADTVRVWGVHVAGRWPGCGALNGWCIGGNRRRLKGGESDKLRKAAPAATKRDVSLRTGVLFLSLPLLMGGPEQVLWRRLLFGSIDCYVGWVEGARCPFWSTLSTPPWCAVALTMGSIVRYKGVYALLP